MRFSWRKITPMRIFMLGIFGAVVTLCQYIRVLPSASDFLNVDLDTVLHWRQIPLKPRERSGAPLKHVPALHHRQTTATASREIDKAQHTITPMNNTSKSSKSYRSLRDLSGWMETNKMNDDYNYCPRKEKFLGPYNYTNQTKNPCWFDNGLLRCIPYFYIVGFSKCATSDLFYKITSQPDVIHDGLKEKHWFDYKRFVENRGFIQNFTDEFKTATSIFQGEINEKGFSSRITADGTPCYVWDSLKWNCYEGNEGLSEPRFTNADVIYHLNPKTKVIIMLREPVSRLYSRMLTWIDEPLHPVYKNASPQAFHDFVLDRIEMHRKCFKDWSVRHCAYNGSLYKNAVLRLMEGVYYVYIKDWLKVFPRDQLLFIKFDDYIQKTTETIRKVFSFLELAQVPEDQLKRGIVNIGKHYTIGPMLNQTRAALEDFYFPFNEELSRLLGDPNFYWGYKKKQG